MTSKSRNATGRTASAVSHEAIRTHDPVAWIESDDDIAAYLEALLEDGDPRVLRHGLRNVATAMGGMAALARRTGLSRETLYRTLSERGNPTLDTLSRVLSAFNLRLAVARRESV